MALITKLQEIDDIYPTSKWDRIDALLAPLEKVERTKLVRYLGQPLLDAIIEDYKAYSADPDAFLFAQEDADLGEDAPQAQKENPKARFKVDVIRSCQEIELYITLSNNVRILSSSLNRGGGFNVMTADNYNTPDDKQFESLKRETWHNAMDSVEHLLLLLENDAEDTQIYSGLWMKSRYYYQHKDLLFTTAVDLQEYLNIDESRERFIQLLPTIRNCQEIYIGTRIGTKLLRDLVLLNTSSEDYDSMYELKSLIKQALSQYVDSELSMSPSEAAKVTAKGMETIRQQRSDAHLNGDRLVGLAIGMILSDADHYARYIVAGSPLAYEYRQRNGVDYAPHTEDAGEDVDAEDSKTQKTEESQCQCCCGNGADKYDAVCDLGGFHLM